MQPWQMQGVQQTPGSWLTTSKHTFQFSQSASLHSHAFVRMLLV